MPLLSYFDKICLILTAELWRALACLYSEARLYNGARVASLSQSTTLHSTGNTSVYERRKSATATHVEQ